ncbi:MAG: hypothetical protein OHM77_06155 [Candidatus Nitricoxidivorans perseverans]|uniref:Uncharacterized protein n=1 Tax=Candidatus Nitricoxidivorans perseverans TaxID=2975601 RepID=A0AA49FMX1_9PROT|nr:MAG: hypothetical protein OHM77_06155 [Candidatus Nitricoxidivorans perseverans]
MSYLERLKNLDSGKRLPTELPKLPKLPYGSFDSSHGAHFQKTHAPAPIVGAGDTAAPFDQEWFEERAGISEFDAGYPRQEAERLAYLEVIQHGKRYLH